MTRPEGISDWRDRYFQRVRPVVGDLLERRRIAVWDISRGYLVAEALARTGVTRQLWLADTPLAAGDPLARSFGPGPAASCGAALAAQIRDHNTFEQGWQLEHHARQGALEVLSSALSRREIDLLLINADEATPQLLRAAIDHGIPAVVTCTPARGVGTLQLIWHPDTAADRRDADDLLACAERLAALPRLSPRGADGHLALLEAQSMALGLARWLLAPGRPQRPDLERPVVAGGRSLLIRGTPEWPWSVRFARPSAALGAALDGGAVPYHPPAALLARERWLVLGLGTASLFCAEAAALVPHLVLLDCKDVSPANPVRQAYGTAQIGQPKGQALAELLARRRGIDRGTLRADSATGLSFFDGGDASLGFGSLGISARDRASVERFGRILDELRPTLAVVAMGRSKDDNFTATAELRRRGIRHVTPTAFPGVSHFKHILTDGGSGPCYDCIQGHLAIDGGGGPTLQPEERELFYGGTQPATLAETLPSAHSLLRLCRDLALPPAARPAYLRRELAAERNCLVGANRAERTTGGWLYGVDRPFQLVTFGVEHLVGSRAEQRCPCGRVNRVRNVVGNQRR